MAKFKMFFSILLFICLAGCSAADSRIYVKNIYLSKNDNMYEIGLLYYDFSRTEEKYEKAVYTSQDIYKLGIKTMSDKNYNFRLCENVYISPELFTDDIGKAVYVINSLKISPNADVICFPGTPPENDTVSSDIVKNPLHSLTVDSAGISGFFPVLTDDGSFRGGIVVKNSLPVNLADRNTALLSAMITNRVKKGEYTFRDGEMWAKIDCAKTHFYTENDTLYVNFSAEIKETKGRHSTIQNKALFRQLLAADISNKIYDIYDNLYLSDYYNLHWYCRQRGTECKTVKVVVSLS